MNTIELKDIHQLEHIIEHLADGIVPIFEIRFFNDNGVKESVKYFYNLDEFKNFITEDKLQKILKDCGYKEKIFFNSDISTTYWEYKK